MNKKKVFRAKKTRTRLYSPQTKPLCTICTCTTLIGFLVQKLHCNVTGFGRTTHTTQHEKVSMEKD